MTKVLSGDLQHYPVCICCHSPVSHGWSLVLPRSETLSISHSTPLLLPIVLSMRWNLKVVLLKILNTFLKNLYYPFVFSLLNILCSIPQPIFWLYSFIVLVVLLVCLFLTFMFRFFVFPTYESSV